MLDELGERVCQPGVDGLSVVDFDAVEQGLVPVPPFLGPCLLVHGGGVADHPEGLVEVLADDVGSEVGGCQCLVGMAEFGGDGVLLALEHLDRHRASQVGVEELVALAFELGDALGLAGGLGGCPLGALCQGRLDELPQGVLLALGEQHGGLVVLGDQFLDFGGGDERQVTVGALLVPSETEEVVVDPAPAFGLREAHARAAPLAADGGAQVVRVGALLLATAVRFEDGLVAGERLDRDQRFVVARHLDAAPGDESDVVGVAQHPPDEARRDRLAALASGLTGS